MKKTKHDDHAKTALAAGGADHPAPGMPLRIALKARDVDGARLEALVYLARKAGRRRRASTWPVERIQSLLCRDVIDVYLAKYLPDRKKGERWGTPDVYRAKIRAFREAFHEYEIGDVGDWMVKEYDERAGHRSPTTRPSDLTFGMMALRKGLRLLGVPPTYELKSKDFKIRKAKRLPKVAWTPEEYDRLRAAADGWLFNADGSPKMIPGPHGFVQARRSRRSIEHREAWRRAILFLTFSGSRGARLPPTRWNRRGEEPWIEFKGHRLIYHRGKSASETGSTKGHGPNEIPVRLEAHVRAWRERDLARGVEFVFSKPDGSRYEAARLPAVTFKQIVRDAAIDEDRIPHHFKDLYNEIADAAGIPREVQAAHLDTSTQTIAEKYGAPMRVALLRQAAEQFSEGPWREQASRIAEVDRLLDEGRRRSVAAAANLAPRPAAGRRQRSA